MSRRRELDECRASSQQLLTVARQMSRLLQRIQVTSPLVAIQAAAEIPVVLAAFDTLVGHKEKL